MSQQWPKTPDIKLNLILVKSERNGVAEQQKSVSSDISKKHFRKNSKPKNSEKITFL